MRALELMQGLLEHPDAAVAAQAAALLNRHRAALRRGDHAAAHWARKAAWSLYDTATSSQSVHTSSHGLDEQM
ncbi:MAG: hypothetical protein K8I04_12610 [Gammaproteobacteria bacterium]|nr:hypothetical protein [Gammaproteobacteria bacterium]